MADEKRFDTGAAAHIDDDMSKGGIVKEEVVASVALGKSIVISKKIFAD